MNKLKRSYILGFAGAAIVAAGCTTLDPYTGEQKTSQAAKGAMIGAGIGAVAGLISGDDAVERRQHAMIGAGIGALAGGAVGNYQDRQEMALRQELEGTGVSVTRDGDNITLNMPGNITFATNSSDLSADFYPVLNSVTKVLNEFNKTVVEVAGHTDSRGSDAYNQSLSERRANSVAAYLRSQNVIQERLITLGLGESRPVADNSTPEGQQANRRVELTLVPLTA
ncbi:MAG TPA: OmpA family protein [Woeseiaceae bacterium]|nr:OmpA family protein [Woeseiaceae bacterium]